MDLDTTTSHKREGPAQYEKTLSVDQTGYNHIYVAGGSHAGRLAAALEEDEGSVVTDLAIKGWSVTEEAVSKLADLISSAKSNTEENVIIYHLFDNCIYRGSTGPGLLAMPRKDRSDGKYHIEGRLTTVDRAAFKEIFNQAVPALRAGGDCRKIIISPLTRYIMGKCCPDPEHITNYDAVEYARDMARGLKDIKNWIAEFAYTKRIQNFIVINPVKCLGTAKPLGSEEVEELVKLWGRDPVHMAPAGYEKLATSILDIINADTQYERCGESASQAPQPHQDEEDRSQQRDAWVTRSDAALQRHYPRDTSARGGNWGRPGRGHGNRGASGWGSRNRGGRRGHHPY